MGIYVNPGNVSFRKALNLEIYIDKTELIASTNQRIDTANCFMCVSRPRRFGKSMAADMLVAYYSKGCDSRELFSGRKVEQLESYKDGLNQRNVIRLDIQRFLESERDLGVFISKIDEVVVGELREIFSDVKTMSAGDKLKTVLSEIFKRTGQGFVFIIDEWDCVFRFAKGHQRTQKAYVDFLRGLFKGAEYVELAYMTGILPIKKYGEHSALNIFEEYSMVYPADLAGYFGFTEREVLKVCEEGQVDFEELQKWYDGYVLNGMHIYNPKSVVDAVRRGRVKSYWTGTETYEALKVYIDLNFDGLKEAIMVMLGNGRCKVNTRRFQNDMTTFTSKDDVLTLLVHLGYLTFDEETDEVFIPNQEIAQEFLNAIDSADWEGVAQALSDSEHVLKCTWNLDGRAVAEGVAAIHNETASMLKYNDENSLTCTVLMAYYSAKAYYMNPVMELPSGKGFADVVYLPKRNVDRPALVVELKWNRSAEGAIAQIKDRQYADWIQGYTGDILLVGIDYDEKKGYECVIERLVKEYRGQAVWSTEIWL